MSNDPSADPRFLACVELMPRTGAKSFQIRFSDDEEPTVWIAVGEWQTADGPVFEAAASLSPTQAVFRLLEAVLDGGKCAHCLRPSGITWDFDTMPMNKQVCWWQWDPEINKFRRGCE